VRAIAAATPPATTPTPPAATPTPIAPATPSVQPAGLDCGDTTAQAISNDMVSAPQTLPLTRGDFAGRWNPHAGDTKTGYGLGKWKPLATGGSYASFSAPIPSTQDEAQVWSIDYDKHYMSSIALMLTPANVAFAKPLATSQLFQSMLSVFSQSPAVLRELGVTLPMTDYRALQGINACTYFSYGADFWVRLVQVSDYPDVYYLYVRSASEAEKDAALARAKAAGPSASASRYAFPPLGPEAFAGFAPPVASIPDFTGNPDGWITPLPSLVIKLKDTAWTSPFIGTVTPSPDGSTIYRFPDADGTPKYALSNPYNAAGMASAVDFLTFMGSDNSLAGYPAAARMFAFLGMAANTPTGEGLFYVDGQRMTCSWVGGTIEKPRRGTDRTSVATLCSEFVDSN
jgi:hypothetical protein